MKINKAYEMVFKEIIKPKEYQRKFDISDELVFITPNSYFGFVFAKKGIPFNLELIKNATQKIDILNIVKPENLFKKTNHFIALHQQGLICVLKNENRKIYINQKYLSFFEDCAEFYQEKDRSIVAVLEQGQVVGAIMPIRYTEEVERE